MRCAIYTRKSSEEGLEQAFNSLDAQREACAAYILSQASEGWTALPEIYDDGGLSGGTLERPALQRLLAVVAAGRIDIIVVYKVDRLTRSLLDFARLVEAFDKAGASFVSVTQSFNTTTSMGRLTLNMLLSFAQFEREVTAECIRDKITASKAKGMWMGGTPPLGYAPDGRSLRIVEEHGRLLEGRLTEELEDLFSRAKSALGFKRKQGEVSVSGGEGSVDTPAFRFWVTCEQDPDDPRDWRIRRRLELRDGWEAQRKEIEEVARLDLDRFVVTFDKRNASYEDVADALEDLADREGDFDERRTEKVPTSFPIFSRGLTVISNIPTPAKSRHSDASCSPGSGR